MVHIMIASVYHSKTTASQDDAQSIYSITTVQTNMRFLIEKANSNEAQLHNKLFNICYHTIT